MENDIEEDGYDDNHDDDEDNDGDRDCVCMMMTYKTIILGSELYFTLNELICFFIFLFFYESVNIFIRI